jgi:phenylalanyl-tRNA synthetase beta chain
MNILWSWLNDHIDVSHLSQSLIKETLTNLGLEVETSTQEGFTLSVTPNRPDCLSYQGVARELSAKLGLPMKDLKKIEIPYSSHKKNPPGTGRLMTLAVDGLRLTDSPVWMTERLMASGIRPLNLACDLTHYLMLETGHPLHAYDRDQLPHALSTRLAHPGETITLLDGQTVTLDSQDLVVVSGQKPVALAGIMGGQDSAIKTETTQRILIEAAQFVPTVIRKTAKRLKLSTDASYRFERGLPHQDLPQVLARAQALLLECQKEGLSFGPIQDSYSEPESPHPIAIRLTRLRLILGMPLFPREKMIGALEKLGFELLDSTEERSLFHPPYWRKDITREIDLIEEVARLEGYDKIPSQIPRVEMGQGCPEKPLIKFIESLEKTLCLMGFSQIVTYPFSSDKPFGLPDQDLKPEVRLQNPLAEDAPYLRASLAPGLWESLQKSKNRNQGEGQKLFQTGRVFFSPKNRSQGGFLTPRAQAEQDRLVEGERLAWILDSTYRIKDWRNGAELPTDFFHGKELLGKCFESLGLRDWHLTGCELSFLHPKIAAWIWSGTEKLGYLGALHPQITEGAPHSPLVCELDPEVLLRVLQKAAPGEIPSVSRFPKMNRDLAFLMDKHLAFEHIEKALLAFPRTHLVGHRLFDLYEGPQIPGDKKSLALSLTFLSPERTLTDQEVEKELADLRLWLSEKVGLRFRV